MTLESIRLLCLSLPNATEQIQWGKDLVFKVGGKMFCVCCTEPVAPPKVALSFKCDDATFAELVERDGVIPAPYLAQHKWVAPEQFDTLGAAELKALIRRAYEIVSAKLPKAKNPATRVKTAKTRSSRSLRAGKAKAPKKAAKKPARKKSARRAARAPVRRGR